MGVVQIKAVLVRVSALNTSEPINMSWKVELHTIGVSTRSKTNKVLEGKTDPVIPLPAQLGPSGQFVADLSSKSVSWTSFLQLEKGYSTHLRPETIHFTLKSKVPFVHLSLSLLSLLLDYLWSFFGFGDLITEI